MCREIKRDVKRVHTSIRQSLTAIVVIILLASKASTCIPCTSTPTRSTTFKLVNARSGGNRKPIELCEAPYRHRSKQLAARFQCLETALRADTDSDEHVAQTVLSTSLGMDPQSTTCMPATPALPLLAARKTPGPLVYKTVLYTRSLLMDR